MTFLIGIMALALIVQAFIGLTFFISSIQEKEPRATLFGGIQFLGMLCLVILFFFLWGFGFFETPLGIGCLIAAYIIGALAVFTLVKRSPANPKALQGTEGLIMGEVKRFDERDQVFARNRALRPGSEEYRAYYEAHPENEAFDTRRRERGGVNGKPGFIDRPHHMPNMAAAAAWGRMSFQLSAPEMVRPEPLPPFQGKQVQMSPEEATERVKGNILNLGADLVGITQINPLWVYAIRGEIFRENWEDWGKEINLDHKYAIVFGTEMSFSMIAPSPHTPTNIESAGQYAKGAYISTMMAQYIANLGYSATANHLRHWEALMVPLAVDAGLGELSRMGYIISKELGPRFRLAAVTTDLPLVPDRPVDIGVEHFCRVCKKCALCCPSNSIPDDDQRVVNGILRWKLNAETCFDYWGKIGTGCNVCMRVCPWSHARTFPHRLIVDMVSRNAPSRTLFTIMDDIFYGRKPKPKTPPEWARFSE